MAAIDKSTLSPLHHTPPSVLAIAFSYLDFRGLIAIEQLSKNIRQNCQVWSDRLWGSPTTQLFSPEMLAKIKQLKYQGPIKELLKQNLFRGTPRHSLSYTFPHFPHPIQLHEDLVHLIHVSIQCHPTATVGQVKVLLEERCNGEAADFTLIAGPGRSPVPPSDRLQNDTQNFAALVSDKSLYLVASSQALLRPARPRGQGRLCVLL